MDFKCENAPDMLCKPSLLADEERLQTNANIFLTKTGHSILDVSLVRELYIALIEAYKIGHRAGYNKRIEPLHPDKITY